MNCRLVKQFSAKTTFFKGPAILCASTMANNGSKNPVKILRGGYEDFSAMYPFLRTQKIIYMPKVLTTCADVRVLAWMTIQFCFFSRNTTALKLFRVRYFLEFYTSVQVSMHTAKSFIRNLKSERTWTYQQNRIPCKQCARDVKFYIARSDSKHRKKSYRKVYNVCKLMMVHVRSLHQLVVK